MKFKKLFIVSSDENIQSELLRDNAEQMGIESEVMYLKKLPKITIDNDILIDNQIISDAIIYCNALKPDYLTVPLSYHNNDFTLFQDYHICQEQNLSLLLSLIQTADYSDTNKVINNPLKSFQDKSFINILHTLNQNNYDIPEYIICNNYKDFLSSELSKNNNLFFWSYPFENSPLKIISKYKIGDLFLSGSNIPFIIYEAIEGYECRLYFMRNTPLTGLLIHSPQYNSDEISLEKFEFILPDERFQDIADSISKFISSDFYSINGVLSKNGKFFITSINTDPIFVHYNSSISEYIAKILLNNLFQLNQEIELQKNIKRDVGFLTRMMEPLFEIERNNAGIK
jgi:hypothetical protein